MVIYNHAKVAVEGDNPKFPLKALVALRIDSSTRIFLQFRFRSSQKSIYVPLYIKPNGFAIIKLATILFLVKRITDVMVGLVVFLMSIFGFLTVKSCTKWITSWNGKPLSNKFTNCDKNKSQTC